MSRLSRKNNKIVVSDPLNDSSEDFAPSSLSSIPIPSAIASLPPKPSKPKKPRTKKTTSKAIDPNLELAIALSASLEKKDILLPGASSWKPPPKKVKSAAKTPLELRSSEERSRLIADRVASILDEGGRKNIHPLVGLYPTLPKLNRRTSSRLVKAVADSKRRLWELSTQKLRADSRFYVPNLLKSFKEPKEEKVGDKEHSSDTSSLMTLSNNLLSLVNNSRGSDIVIHLQGDKEIHAHSIIFYSRLPAVLKDLIIEEGSSKHNKEQILCWPEVHSGPAHLFLSFIYGACLPQGLSTKSELHGLRFLANKYNVQALQTYLKDIVEGSLIDDSDEIESYDEKEEENKEQTASSPSATQNLIQLIDALEKENDPDDVSSDKEEKDKHELSDIQEFIFSQRPPTKVSPERTLESPEKENIIDLTQESESGSVAPNDPCSPDIFQDDDEEYLSVLDEPNVSRKRKSDSVHRSSKLSKLDFDSDTDDLFSLPTPSKNSEGGDSFCEILSSSGGNSQEGKCLKGHTKTLLSSSQMEHTSPNKGSLNASNLVHRSTDPPLLDQFSPGNHSLNTSSYKSANSSSIEHNSLNQASLNPSFLEQCSPKEAYLNASTSSSPNGHTSLNQASLNPSFLEQCSPEKALLNASTSSSPNEHNSLNPSCLEHSSPEKAACLKASAYKSPNLSSNKYDFPSFIEHNSPESTPMLPGRQYINTNTKKASPTCSKISMEYSPSKKTTPKPLLDKELTPMMDYDSMLTPALREELKKFGLKAVPRTKACRLLKYVYEETHRELTVSETSEAPNPSASCSQASSADSSFEDLPEESLHFSPEQSPSTTQRSELPGEMDLPEKIKTFIRTNQVYWRQVLEYEPIWLEDFVSAFKSSGGVPKVKETQILDFFDNECITFRSRKSLNRRGKKGNSPKKAASSK